MGKGYLSSTGTCPRCRTKANRLLHPLEEKLIGSTHQNPITFSEMVKLYFISEIQMWFGSRFKCEKCGNKWRE